MTSNRRIFLKQLGCGAAGLSWLASCPELFAESTSTKLPRATPESQGVSSPGISAFLEAVGKSKHEFHSFMLLRHGQVVSEGWWSPYRADLNHMLYSLSKSFTSTAIGLAVSEGKLTVEDKVISFFPNDLPEKVSDNLAALRVKDLLTMSVGHAQDSTNAVRLSDNWVKNFLALPIPNTPGTQFLYNSGATYMLSAIVQKLTGQKVIDYLKPRLFDPLGIEGMKWDTCPKGINTGGWGLNIQTEGLAKFGLLYLRKGDWNGRRVLPEKWVEEATSFKIQQPIPEGGSKEHNDWLQGYCYQFWRCQHNGFRGDGAFGQYTVVLPEQDVVLAITSETSDMQGVLNLVWDILLPAMQDKALPEDKAAQEKLEKNLASLALLPPKAKESSPMVDKISGKVFVVEKNEMNVQEVSFQFKEGSATFTLKNDQSRYHIRCGLEKWVLSEQAMPGTPPNLVKSSTSGRRRLPASLIAASGTWKDENAFEMTWRYCETPHHDTVTCHFDGSQVKVGFNDSMVQMNPQGKDARPELSGRIQGA